MKISRLSGGLAVACLLVSTAVTSASAQTRRDAYGNPKANSAPRATAPTYRAPVRQQPTYSAPASSNAGVRFGVRAGLNVADWKGDAVQSAIGLTDFANGAITQSTRPAVYAGLYATLPLGSRFAIEPAVVYSEKGTVLTGTLPIEALDFLNARASATARLSYIDVPVVAKAYITDGFYVFAGPQASFLASGKARVKAGALGITAYQQDFDISNQLRTVDFALVGGLGYQFSNGLGLSAGYDYGLSSLDKNNYLDAYNRVVKVGVNYSF